MSFSIAQGSNYFQFRPKGFGVLRPVNLIQSLPGLGFWLDASAISTLSYDGSDRVDTWRDLSPNGYDVTQVVNASKPTYVSSTSRLNNKPTVEFNDDYLSTSSVLDGAQGEVFAVVSLSSLSTTNQNLLAQSDFSGSAGPITLIRPYQDFSSQQGMGFTQRDTDTVTGTTELVGNTTISVDTPYLMYWRSDGSTVTFRLNGASESLDVTQNNNGNWFGDMSGTADLLTVGKLGLNSTYIQQFLGNLGELVVITGTNLTTQQRDDTEDFLLGKWGF